MHRAFGALQSVIGGRQQQFGRSFHRRGALAHGLKNAFDAGAERTDRRINGAPSLLALAQRVALFLGGKLFGDVGMGGKPAAAAHRPADQRDDAPILEFEPLGFSSIFGGLAQKIGDIAVRIAVEIAGGEPVHQQIAQRRSRSCMFGPQVIHIDIDSIAQHQTRGTVEHAQPLRHVVERRPKQSCLLAPPAIDEQTGDCRRAEAERQADHKLRRRSGQHGDDPGRSAQREQRDADGKAGGPRDGDERPVAAELGQIWSSEHRVRRQENGKEKRQHLAADRLF